MNAQVTKPSKTLFVFSGILFFLAFIVVCGAGYGGWGGISSFINADTPRFQMPGSHLIHYDQPQDVSIFYEHHSDFQGKVFDTSYTWPNLDLTVTNTQSGESIPVKPSSGSTNYDLPSRSGYKVAQFYIPSAGEYRIATSDADASASPVVIMVGQLKVFSLVFGILIATFGLMASGACLVVAVILLIIGLVRRRQYAKTQS